MLHSIEVEFDVKNKAFFEETKSFEYIAGKKLSSLPLGEYMIWLIPTITFSL